MTRGRIARLCGTACLLALLAACAARPSLAAPEDGGDGATGEPDVAVEDGVSAWMAQMDLSDWQEIVHSLPESVQEAWRGVSPEELIGQFAVSADFSGITERAGTLRASLASLWKRELPLLLLLTAVGLASAFCGALAPDGADSGLAKTGSFVCRCFALTAAATALASRTVLCMEGIGTLSGIMEATLPALYLLLTAMGAAASAGVLQPATALLSGSVTAAVRTVILPLTVTGGVVALLDGLSGESRLSGISDFLKKTGKWMTGGMTALYIGAISIGGLVSASYDTMTVRTAKFAASSTLPLVGGMVSGSLDTILGCAVLVKNAAGLTAILLAAAAAAVPLFRLLLLGAAFRLSAALIQPVAEKRLVSVYENASAVIGGLIGAYLAVFLMFLVSVGLALGLFGQIAGAG